MKTIQKLITSTYRPIFDDRVNEMLSEGWQMAPESLRITASSKYFVFACLLFKEVPTTPAT